MLIGCRYGADMSMNNSVHSGMALDMKILLNRGMEASIIVFYPNSVHYYPNLDSI